MLMSTIGKTLELKPAKKSNTVSKGVALKITLIKLAWEGKRFSDSILMSVGSGSNVVEHLIRMDETLIQLHEIAVIINQE